MSNGVIERDASIGSAAPIITAVDIGTTMVKATCFEEAELLGVKVAANARSGCLLIELIGEFDRAEATNWLPSDRRGGRPRRGAEHGSGSPRRRGPELGPSNGRRRRGLSGDRARGWVRGGPHARGRARRGRATRTQHTAKAFPRERPVSPAFPREPPIRPAISTAWAPSSGRRPRSWPAKPGSWRLRSTTLAMSWFWVGRVGWFRRPNDGR